MSKLDALPRNRRGVKREDATTEEGVPRKKEAANIGETANETANERASMQQAPLKENLSNEVEFSVKGEISSLGLVRSSFDSSLTSPRVGGSGGDDVPFNFFLFSDGSS